MATLKIGILVTRTALPIAAGNDAAFRFGRGLMAAEIGVVAR